MTDDERVIAECLRAAVEGPFFRGPVFHTLIGCDRDEVVALLKTWPQSSREAVDRVVRGALVNLLWYPHHQMAAWDTYLSVPYEELEAVLDRWCEATRPPH